MVSHPVPARAPPCTHLCHDEDSRQRDLRPRDGQDDPPGHRLAEVLLVRRSRAVLHQDGRQQRRRRAAHVSHGELGRKTNNDALIPILGVLRRSKKRYSPRICCKDDGRCLNRKALRSLDFGARSLQGMQCCF